MLRTTDDICTNNAEIKKLVNSENNLYKLNMILLHKYKIRTCVPEFPTFIDDKLYKSEREAHKNKYKIMTSDKIYTDVMRKSR